MGVGTEMGPLTSLGREVTEGSPGMTGRPTLAPLPICSGTLGRLLNISRLCEVDHRVKGDLWNASVKSPAMLAQRFHSVPGQTLGLREVEQMLKVRV